jgi:hypothetical protein
MFFVLLCCGAMPAVLSAQTLREAIEKNDLTPDPKVTTNLDKRITSGAELDDESQFVIAYYIDDGSGRLNLPLFLERYDRGSKEWRSAILGKDPTQPKSPDDVCNGSISSINAVGHRLILDTHINPSAGCLLVVSPDLKLEASLYGWFLGRLGDNGLIYHRSEIHFAPVHPAEIAFHDLKTKRDYTIFPHKPDQAIRTARIAQLREFYKTRERWCQKWNDPCDAERFDSDLDGDVATNEAEHALAFVISYEQWQRYPDDEQKPSGPQRVLYVYRHVDDESKLEFREMLPADAKAKFGEDRLEKLLEASTLRKIFAEPAAH